MALVIAVTQQKGGAGKTMLAANLAAALAATRRVAVLDIDPQRSLSRWHELRAARAGSVARVHGSDVSGWRLANELDRLVQEHDAVLVDSPPQIDTDARRAVRAADLVLVPVQPSAPDLWAAEGTLKLAHEERRRVCLVLNRVPATGRAREAAEAEMRALGHAPLPVALGNRAAFSRAFAEGLGVTEAAPRSAAAAEMRALLAAVEEAAS